MAREKLVRIESDRVKYYKPAHNPTGELFKVIHGLIVLKKNKH